LLAEQTWGRPGPITDDGDEPSSWAPAAHGLVIAIGQAPGTTMLVPFDGLTEWQVWNLHNDTSEAYLSFRSFLEYQVTLREPVTTVVEAAALVARGRAGDHLAVMPGRRRGRGPSRAARRDARLLTPGHGRRSRGELPPPPRSRSPPTAWLKP